MTRASAVARVADGLIASGQRGEAYYETRMVTVNVNGDVLDEGNDLVPLRLGQVGDGDAAAPGHRDAGVGEHDVQAAEVVDRRRHRGQNRCGA